MLTMTANMPMFSKHVYHLSLVHKHAKVVFFNTAGMAEISKGFGLIMIGYSKMYLIFGTFIR